MANRRPGMLLLITTALACGSQPSSPQLVEHQGTGLEGTVLLGPTQPVCRPGEACDAPFSAGFEAWHGQQLVARFRSDSAGHYRVALMPGAYVVVADSAAPIWPGRQAHDVVVGNVGFTHVDLDFDTGIR
jgi:hypothetical protein